MQGPVNIYKPKGFTPLQAIEAYKAHHPELLDVKMTYAGRLDPMAEGVLPILIGEDVHKKEDVMHLDKQYEAEILLGISTDSYDTLGIVTSTGAKIPRSGLADELMRFKGSNLLAVPPYSSVIVNSHPLFYWARQNKLDEIETPQRTMTVHDIEVLSVEAIDASEVLQSVKQNVGLVKGDFRQKETLENWRTALKDRTEPFVLVRAMFHVASGTYIRAIAHEFGRQAGCGAILYNLKRTTVGAMKSDDSERITTSAATTR